MLKITKMETNGPKVILKLEGKITDQWAALLDGECRAAIRDGKRVELDCTGVAFIDSRGLQVLKSLPRRHLTLSNAPGYMRELLQTGG